MKTLTSNYSNKRVAITGGSGYIAGALLAALTNSNTSVLRVSRSLLPEVSGINTLQADLSEPGAWETIVEEADIIFHLSGNTSIYAAAKDPVDSLRSTLLPILHLINAAQKRKKKPRVVFASTVTLYGLKKELPVDETRSLAPATIYDLHKFFSEEQLKLASQQNILEPVIMRLANVYGPSSGSSSSKDRGILNRIVKQAMAGEKLSIYGDGNYIRDYIHINDVVAAFLTAGLADNISGEAFNVSTGIGITVAEAFNLAADKVEKLKGVKSCICFVEWPDGSDPLERRDFIGDNRKLQRMTGGIPQINLEQGIDSLISYYAS